MKAVILSNPQQNKSIPQSERFRIMVSALRLGGINGTHHILHSHAHLLRVLHAEQPDIVFSAADHTMGDQDRYLNIHKILDALDIAYVGSGPETIELVLSKSEMKNRWKTFGICTPDYFLIRRSGSRVCGLEKMVSANGYPYILKPDREGNSRGLDEDSIVFTQQACEAKLSKLLDQYDEVLVERYLGLNFNMREYTVAMIGNGDRMVLMPAEVTLLQEKKPRIITSVDKERHFTRLYPVYDHELKERLVSFARQAFQVAGVRDYARCDVIYLDEQFYAIEINGQPMVPAKWFDACARVFGLNSPQYINSIFLAAFARNLKQGKSRLAIPDEMKGLLPKIVYNVLLNF